MALQKKTTLKIGMEVENAYFRIEYIEGTKKEVTFCLAVYLDQQSCLDGRAELESSYYTFTPIITETSLNHWKQAYEYLKTLEEFADAVDILENEGEVI